MKSYKIGIGSGFAGWDRYGVYLTAVCFGADGQVLDYINLTDKSASLQTPPCDRADIYLYVIAEAFPASDAIAASPPFEVELVVSDGGSTPKTYRYEVNQWGGLSAKLTI